MFNPAETISCRILESLPLSTGTERGGEWICVYEKLSWILFFFLMFWPCSMACGMSVPQPGIEPLPSAVEAQSLNRWSTKEVASLGRN